MWVSACYKKIQPMRTHPAKIKTENIDVSGPIKRSKKTCAAEVGNWFDVTVKLVSRHSPLKFCTYDIK